MKKFNYKRPNDLNEAVAELTPSQNITEEKSNGETGRLIAGGTDIVGALKTKISPFYPDNLISLRDTGLNYIKEDDEYISIGAMTTLSDIEKNKEISEKAPLLAQAARSIASPQIRHQATIGGNVCQEPRCWYYRHPDNHFHCMRKGGSLCNALTGNNAYHSVFGATKVIKSPCEIGCPNETNIPAYFDAIRRQNYDEAAKIFMKVNPMGAITGRVCPHDCQNECNRNEFDESVSIRDVERFIGDHALKNIKKLTGQVDEDTGKRVSIIGAGPAGLTAAYYLALKGHKVKVFDKNEKAGGMLRYSIPAYRLPKNIIDDYISFLESIGVAFILGDQVDKDATLKDYRKDTDSVIVACGAWNDNKMKFKGSEAALSGLQFLYDVNSGNERKPGNDVVVIGGGNVAIDVAVTAKRLGSNVTIIYRRTMEEMPANDWEIEDALSEGVVIKESLSPHEISTDDNKITSINGAKCTSSGGRGSKVTVDTNDIENIPADCVIMAIGQEIDTSLFKEEFKNGHLHFVKGTFAAGDVVNGPATVVEAIAGGRETAYSVHKFLTGNDYGTDTSISAEAGKDLHFDKTALMNSSRTEMENLSLNSRCLNLEDAKGFTDEQAGMEANRCFNCGCVAVTPSDIAPALVALDAIMITTDALGKTPEKTVAAKDFFKIGIETSTSLKPKEILKEIKIPKEYCGNSQSYQKFRTRKTIDFPIAGLAANLKINNNKIEDAKLVLGGAAPIPKCLKEVENYLVGKEVTEQTANEAGKIATSGMMTLAENRYKIHVFNAMIKRALFLFNKET